MVVVTQGLKAFVKDGRGFVRHALQRSKLAMCYRSASVTERLASAMDSIVPFHQPRCRFDSSFGFRETHTVTHGRTRSHSRTRSLPLVARTIVDAFFSRDAEITRVSEEGG
jgi:hypothetical protein|eukprot:4286418-Prymnesium_polylepis.1